MHEQGGLNRGDSAPVINRADELPRRAIIDAALEVHAPATRRAARDLEARAGEDGSIGEHHGLAAHGPKYSVGQSLRLGPCATSIGRAFGIAPPTARPIKQYKGAVRRLKKHGLV